jgi:hypothetical protein
MESTKTVTFHLDPLHPPTMTDAEMQALRELRDDQIDFSDIPPQPRRGWRRVSELVPYVTAQKKAL